MWYGCRLWTTLFLLFLTFLPGATAGLLQKITGEWKGQGHQYDGPRWPIELTVPPDGSPAIAYPSLKCGGTLTLLEELDNGARFREDLSYGRECINRGTVRLILVEPGRLEFFWYLPGGKLHAQGELTRHFPNPPPPLILAPLLPMHGPR